MDILYYSNHCKHSQKVIKFFVQNNLMEQLNFICIDNRKYDNKTGQIYVILEKGDHIVLPPNIHSVPALLLVKQNYSVVMGDDIISRYQQKIQNKKDNATFGNGEPLGVSLDSVLGNGSVVSEQYTSYNATPQELSSKGRGGTRSLYNYVSANEDIPGISTPPDTYHPDKVSENITVELLEKKRQDEIGVNVQKPTFLPASSSI